VFSYLRVASVHIPLARRKSSGEERAVLSDQEFLHIVDATPLVSIDLIVRNEQGEVLLGRRLNRPAKDSWFVPGGRIRKNERVSEALRRISQRELGVLIEHAELVGVFDHIYEDNFLGTEGVNTHYVVLGFAARLPEQVKLTPDDQHGELRWWTLAEISASEAVHENTKAYFNPPA
jgi:colanic acid biosynthesis protein WcaH